MLIKERLRKGQDTSYIVPVIGAQIVKNKVGVDQVMLSV